MIHILTNKKIKSTVTISIYLLIVAFIVVYIQRLDFAKVSSLEVNWWYIVAAVPFSILSRVFLPYIWIQLISIYKEIDSLNEYWQLNYVYAKSWLGRYIPGNFAGLGGKIYFALERGISKTILGVTSLVEATLQLLTGLLLGVIFLYISGAYSNFSIIYNLFFLGSAVVGLVIISPPIFNLLLKSGYKIVKKKKLDEKYFIKLQDLIKIAILYFFVHALSGLPIYFLIRAIGFELGFIELLYVSGAFIFAGAVGTLAIFAPSGLGVREGVILLFLVNTLPTEISVLLVIVLRIWTIILDLIYWVLSYTIIKVFK